MVYLVYCLILDAHGLTHSPLLIVYYKHLAEGFIQHDLHFDLNIHLSS